ncbi:proton-conducting transporter membrane subunit [Sinomonas sp. JGH33]|uniref:Proton-conducting transporter membrane subunit n=1 Tax=Sinomonas terricola TaxID=3110330 RepID=A0ABU5TBP3_9MICC|nr:proton-conducting transporter membrane subunit [Sinomonas sp. JGH33]MEA5457110.1 proton-conducting transporter membrane subunit [Sinomonas sp. JGH33]
MNDVILLVPVLAPLVGAAVYVVFGWRPTTAWTATVSAALVLASGALLAADVLQHGPRMGLLGLVRVDALAAFMLVVVGAVALLAASATPAWLRGEIAAGRAEPRTAARHSLLVQLFLAAMAWAVMAANVGMVWVSIEATTIVTAFLVGQRRSRAAVEAAWKYVVICSTGIAVALLGILLLDSAASHVPGHVGLDWVELVSAAPHLDPGVTRIAVALMIVGFGTKAGLAPLHSWLPDAHGQAPAPVSALMSGVLLAVAFSVVLRVKAVSDAALGVGFARTLLVAIALATLAVSASLMIRQRDYKRMLAYSSMEHLGIIAFGAAAGGPLGTAAVLLHVLGHGLVKGVLFLGAGQVLQTTGTSRIDAVRGLAARAPIVAGCVGVGVLALIGFPPFSVFASELGIVRAGFATGLGWAAVPALVLVLVIAAALVVHTSRMLFARPSAADEPSGPPSPSGPEPEPALPRRLAAMPLLLGLVVCSALGVTAGPLAAVLDAAAQSLTGAP